MEAEAEPLDLFVAGKTQLVPYMMADGLGEIVVYHCEQTTQDTDGQKNKRRRQSAFSAILPAVPPAMAVCV